MDLGLAGKVALITGGSEGIGKATAKLMAAEGALVAIAARRIDVLTAAAAEIEAAGGQALAVAGDVTCAADTERMVAETVARFGRLDIVVNNAGAKAARPFLEISDEAWSRDLDLKLLGAVRVSRAAIPHLRQAGGGRIINITTVSGKTPGANTGPSSVSRAAGIALTKAMAGEFAADNILVNTICVGTFKSAQHPRLAAEEKMTLEAYYARFAAAIPLGRVGETEEAARAIVFLASSAASYITGASLNVDGGAAAVV